MDADHAMQPLAQREGITGRYHYIGPRSDVPDVLRTLDILVLPSERDKEAFPRIVVEAMGQGNVPPGAVNGIARACEMNIPVVITTRCQSGPVRPYYAYEGAGLELKRLGCIFAPYLTGPKARIKLMLALNAGSIDEVLAFPLERA